MKVFFIRDVTRSKFVTDTKMNVYPYSRFRPFLGTKSFRLFFENRRHFVPKKGTKSHGSKHAASTTIYTSWTQPSTCVHVPWGVYQLSCPTLKSHSTSASFRRWLDLALNWLFEGTSLWWVLARPIFNTFSVITSSHLYLAPKSLYLNSKTQESSQSFRSHSQLSNDMRYA